jgi:hypothetical protein
MIHQHNPLLVSWDAESGCFIVSDFSRRFKPVLTAESLAEFIKSYAEHSPEITKWTLAKGISYEARPEAEDRAIADWLSKYEVPRVPKAPEAPPLPKNFTIEDLLK